MGYQRQSQTRKTEGNSQPQGERSASYTPHPIEELQGLIGNRAMGQILQAQRMSQESEISGDSALGRGIAPLSQGSILRKPLFRGLSHELKGEKEQQGTLVQAKLMVGKADDRFEEEADRVAAQVVQQLGGQTSQQLSQGETVQREEKESEERLQRKPSVESLSVVEGGMAASSELEASIQGARGSGQPLSPSVREPIEREFGADFSGVRVHTDAKSDQMSQSMQAKAFTTGEDIFFRQGAYEPSRRVGKELLAHELTHVVQQNANKNYYPSQDQSGGLSKHGNDEIKARTQIQRGSTLSPKVVQRAGSKIAFEAKPSTQSRDKELIEEIRKAIIKKGKGKKAFKNRIEIEKDENIEKEAKKEEEEINKLRGSWEEKKKKREEIQKSGEVSKTAHLKYYHNRYKSSGWKLEEVIKSILEETKDEVTIGPKKEEEIEIKSRVTGNTIFSIYFGNRRFSEPQNENAKDNQPYKNAVFKKRGTEKEYVKDSRGVFITRYVYRGCKRCQMEQLFKEGRITPRNPSMEIGKQINRYDFGVRAEGALITQAEREFLQQRDGSGPDQRMLSVTHAKRHRKIHSNRGHMFTDYAVIKIDLALIPPQDISNIHMEETHEAKTSLVNKIYARGASIEKESYVYSAEKNRETLLNEVPLDAVVGVVLEGQEASLEGAQRAVLRGKLMEVERGRVELKEREEKEKRKEGEAERGRGEEERYKSIHEQIKSKSGVAKLNKVRGVLEKIDVEVLKEYERATGEVLPEYIMVADILKMVIYIKDIV